VIDPDWALVAEAARVKAGGGVSYAGAFCIATALRVEAPLWTGDPEIVERAADHRARSSTFELPDRPKTRRRRPRSHGGL
jgi:hypothetical protein